MYSIIALSGPHAELQSIQFPDEVKFDRRIDFPTPPSGVGNFPDTSGYTRRDYEKLSLTNEDSQLHKYMMKCVDAVDQFASQKIKSLEKLGMDDIRFDMHGNSMGGTVFAIVGFIHYRAPRITVVH
jgi:hypothetical protein